MPKTIAAPQAEIGAHLNREDDRITFGKYRDSRFWAIWINDELLAVTVYRKGAKAILAYCNLEQVAMEIPASSKRAPR